MILLLRILFLSSVLEEKTGLSTEASLIIYDTENYNLR